MNTYPDPVSPVEPGRVVAPSRGRTWPALPDRWFLPVLVVVSTVLRFPGLLAPPSSDEAGFLLVARHWAPSPDNMYGAYWVDRPPVLIAAYRWVDDLAGSPGPRLLAAVLAAVLVVAIQGLARRLTNERAARVAAVTAVALLANPGLSAWTAKGEVIGTPFVVLSCLAAVAAIQAKHAPRQALLATAAGLTAVLAVGFKQNLLGGFVFGAVLLLGALVTGRVTGPETAHLARYAVLGAAVPVTVVAVWVILGPAQLDSAWYQIFGFRADASRVLAASDSHAPVERAAGLWRLFLGTGMAALVVLAVLTCRVWLRGRGPVGLALVAMTAVDVVGVVLGGSYWHAYLIPLVPDLALAAALVCSGTWRHGVAVRAVAAVVALSSALALVGFVQASGSRGPGPWDTGRAIAAVARPDDTIVSLYGSADLVLGSSLDSPYEHLWSLPMRTLDPDLARLRDLLSGPEAPTWLVMVLPVSSWHLDADLQIRDLISRRYVLVKQPCGPMIWLRRTSGYRALPQVEC